MKLRHMLTKGEWKLTACAAAISSALAAAPAVAHAKQGAAPIIMPVLMMQQGRGTLELRAALQRLSRNANDLDALIDAGNAALLLKDPDGALGFFARAERLNPRNARVKAGLASALLGTENPYEALRLFDEALRLGMTESFIAADRGLAYDLVGNNANAQRDYKLALKRGGGDEVTMRYALSLGISGDTKGAERLLNPLLHKNIPAAWRMRAFILAINGDKKEARKVARGTMPRRLAASIQPYLDYMPRLTKSQQAAAAHFGHFPKTANIGRPNPRNTQYASVRGGTGADAGLIPTGKPLGDANQAKPATQRKASKKQRRRPGQRNRADWRRKKIEREALIKQRQRQNKQVAAVSADKKIDQNAKAPVSLPANITQKPVTASATKPQIAVNNNMGTARTAGSPKPKPAQAPVQIASASKPPVLAQNSGDTGRVTLSRRPVLSVENFDLAKSVPAQEAERSETAYASSNSALDKVKRDQVAPARRPSFDSLMSDINVPEAELKRDSRAVDLATITPAKAKPKPKSVPAKPAEPVHPARQWVQIAIGQDTSLFASEWRRLSRKAPDAFKDTQGWMVPINKTNRLLAGPFDDARAAQAFVNQLAKSDMAAMPWKSAKGEKVTKVGKK